MRRGVRVAAAEVDIYIMTVFKAGSETDSAEALSFPDPAAHQNLQRGDMGRASAGHTQPHAEMHWAPGCQWDVRAKALPAGSHRPHSLGVLRLSPLFLVTLFS